MTNNGPTPGRSGLDVELRSLAGRLDLPDPDDRIVETVLARLDLEPVPGSTLIARRVRPAVAALGQLLRNRWRMAGVALAATLVLLLAVTPAGAKVREWLGFGAVVVEQQEPAPTGEPSATQTSAIPGSPADPAMSLEQAQAAVTFPIGVPAALGEPDLVTVSTDGRLVSMQWSDSPSGTVRLDQIDGALSPYFVKKYYQDVDFTTVDNAEALWLSRPHPIAVLNPDGSERAESARQSGPSLVWQRGDVTLRLEGVDDMAAAVAVAQTMPN